MRRFTSPARSIFSNNNSTTVWNPLTGAIPLCSIGSARFAVWLAGATSVSGAVKIKVQPGFEFSDDGQQWLGTTYGKAVDSGKTYTSADGWSYGDSAFTIEGAGAALYGYVRFGLLALNTDPSLPMQYAQGRIDVSPVPIATGSVNVPPTRVWTKNDDNFVPLTGPMRACDVTTVRAEIELTGVGSTSMSVQPAWQAVNDPGVDTDWSAMTAFGTARTADGYYGAGTFASVSTTKQYVRLGVYVSQASGGDVRSCIARARFDWRA